MKKALLWQISQNGPKRIGDGKLKLEEHLEEWIVADPDLLQVGLTVIARQLVVEAGIRYISDEADSVQTSKRERSPTK